VDYGRGGGYCSGRTTTLGQKMPTDKCTKCHKAHWRRCSMGVFREQSSYKGPDLEPAFLARGEKQANSLRS
jgi:hypothetical protein